MLYMGVRLLPSPSLVCRKWTCNVDNDEIGQACAIYIICQIYIFDNAERLQ